MMNKLSLPNWQKKEDAKRRIWAIVLCAVFAIPLVGVGAYFVHGFVSEELSIERIGKDIYVRAGGDLQAALHRAQPGDRILLQAGAEFRGPYTLPVKSGAEFITIRSSVSDASLPARDERIDPKKYASKLPRLISTTTDPVVNIVNGAHHYRFVGVEFGGTKDGFFNIVQIGTTEEEKLSDIPHHIEFDRVFIHATSPNGQRRGIAANGRNLVIKNSHISGIVRKGEESQAIAVWGSNGPVEIINNYLEAGAENILFGGASSKLKLVPTDCVVRGNTLNKPVEWRGKRWLVKNLFEIKNGKNITVTDNIMTNNWAMGQDGTAVLFTVREDNGPATRIENVLFQNNVIRGSGGALSVYGDEGSGGHRLTIRNNLFADIDGRKWGGSGQFLKVSDWQGLVIENNTVIHNGNITTAYGEPVNGFIFRNNIVFNNDYGMIGDDASPGKETLDRYFPRARVERNIFVGGSERLYGRSNFYVKSIDQIGFTDREAYRLTAGNRFEKKGHEGKPIGYVAK
ncbi:MAG: hypothetical protein HKN33_06970 [Pyrinomonadaceae bacterium]|nr:hypothetical protein [Pyrinomonadaceae bacterium]